MSVLTHKRSRQTITRGVALRDAPANSDDLTRGWLGLEMAHRRRLRTITECPESDIRRSLRWASGKGRTEPVRRRGAFLRYA